MCADFILSLSTPSAAPSAWSRALGPVLFAIAYYGGAQIGFALQSPSAPQSVLWLPNSILLATLLIVPLATWPYYFLAAFPAQMLVAWGAGGPFFTLALLFLTNCADAALGAYLVRRFSGRTAGPFRLDDLRAMLIFAAFGATLPTILLSFADAGVSVATGWAPVFHAAFITRVRSNVLTHLIVVPACLDAANVDWRHWRRSRVAEAAAIAALVVVACAAAFAGSAESAVYPAVLYAPMPLLLWAAFRFGPGGAGAGVLLVALIASWDTLHGRGPFISYTPADDVLALQLFLLASATPLLVLAAVVRERNRATDRVHRNEAALRRSYARVRELAGKLITAQELERARIARDMHDDFNQQLAVVSIGISGLRSRISDRALAADLQALQDRTVALTDRVRHFSHDLHPQALEHVGLPAALRAHCAEFGRQHLLRVHLVTEGDLEPIARDIAICAYRIVQEGLRNVQQHAGVTDVHVTVERRRGQLDLTIVDGGRGFDIDAPAARDGLGLLSIEERSRLVGGSFTIASVPGRGTTLRVQIPMSPR
ncbi:MAG TPA: MASE1 domain-containing protein [Vicinamibacterales bacterium]